MTNSPIQSKKPEPSFSVEYFRYLGKEIRNQKFKFDWQKFLIGLFSMPWIWVFTYLILSTVAVAWLLLSQDDASLKTAIINKGLVLNNLSNFWIFIAVSSVTNYTVSHIIKSKHLKLEIFLFLINLLILLVFMTQIWPFLGILLFRS